MNKIFKISQLNDSLLKLVNEIEVPGYQRINKKYKRKEDKPKKEILIWLQQ